MGRDWEEGEREGEAKRRAEDYCRKEGEWIDLVHEYELREMAKEIFCGKVMSEGTRVEWEAAVRRWVGRNWEDFLPGAGDSREEFDYEENRA